MANDSDGGKEPAESKKSGQGGRNRRWRRRRGPAAQPGDAQARPQAENQPERSDRPAGGPPENNASGNQPARGTRRPSRGRGGRGANQRQNQNQPGPASQPSAPAQPAAQDGSQGRQGQRRQRPGRRDEGNRPGQGQRSRPPAASEPREQTGQRPARDSRGGQRQPQNPNRADRSREPRQNAPDGVAPRRRASIGGNRGQAPFRQQFGSSTPLKARGGIKARSSEGGEFGKNWWAKRWLLAMERLMDGARLQRGRRYARMGQVLSMNEVNGNVVAKVQGSRPQPYKVVISVSPFSDDQWDQVLDVLAGRAIFAAQLLAGEMPPTIEEAFSAAGISLFPARGGDLHSECSCPDWANPCKHIAATQYILADRFDEDPFLLFRMRGRTQENILQALRLRRTGSDTAPEPEPQTEEETGPALEEGLHRFWEMGPGLEQFSANVQQPQISLPLFKRLGEPDVARGHSLEENLGPALEVISQTALFLAFTDTSREAAENGDAAQEK